MGSKKQIAVFILFETTIDKISMFIHFWHLVSQNNPLFQVNIVNPFTTIDSRETIFIDNSFSLISEYKVPQKITNDEWIFAITYEQINSN